MAVTSQPSKPTRAPDDILITEWEKAGLLKPSLIKPVFATLERGLILRKLGELRWSCWAIPTSFRRSRRLNAFCRLLEASRASRPDLMGTVPP
jgi:hypothetical protein